MENIFVNYQTRIRKDVIMHIRRTMPSTCHKVNVNAGDEVLPNDVLAEGQNQAGFRTIDLSRELGVGRKEGVRYLQRPIGSNIFREELLAAKEGVLGLGKKLVLSPADGVLDFFDEKTGVLKIKLFPRTIKLACGVWGIVDEVDQVGGFVVIRTQASVVYGLLGCGKEREGILCVLGSNDLLVGSRQIKETMRGQILVGGEVVFSDALEKAVEAGVSGIITGGINAKEIKAMSGGWNISQKQWSDVGLSLVSTEGFGSVPIGEDVYTTFSSHNGKFSIIDGNRRRVILPSDDNNSMINIRKTKLARNTFIESGAATGQVQLQVGEKIKVISQSKFGALGIVEAIDTSNTKLPSGVITRLVTVATKSAKLRIPFQNLEVVY